MIPFIALHLLWLTTFSIMLPQAYALQGRSMSGRCARHFRLRKSFRKLTARGLYSESENLIQRFLITSDTNDKVKLLKSLQMKKKREINGLLLLEGHRQIIDAIQDGHIPKTLLYSDKSLDAPLGNKLAEVLQLCPSTSVFRATDEIIQSIADTVTSQGVVAAFPKPVSLETLPSEGSPLIVFLDRPADPGNVGTIIRTAYGLGVDAIVIADGCDPWSPKVLRSAMGACLKIPIVETKWENVPALLPGLLQSSVQILLADAAPSAIPYHQADYTLPTIIVIGSEADGIGKQAAALPNSRRIIIPMMRPLESFNAAVACSILLGEATRQRQCKS
jgi:TrmH family RNA methyltransferase